MVKHLYFVIQKLKMYFNEFLFLQKHVMILILQELKTEYQPIISNPE